MKLRQTDRGLMWGPEDVREEHDWIKLKDGEYLIPVCGRQGERLVAIVPDVDSYKKSK